MSNKAKKKELLDQSSDMEEIKRSLNFMSVELAKLSSQKTLLMDLVEEIKHLKLIISNKDKKIDELEQKIDELEQNARQDNIVITGLEVKPRSYARVVTGAEATEHASQQELQTLEKQVVSFLQDKDIDIEHNNICLLHLAHENG